MKQNRVPYSKPIPVKLPPEVLDRLDAISKKIGEPRSTVMRIALRIGLEGLEKAAAAEAPTLGGLMRPSSGSGREEAHKIFGEVVERHKRKTSGPESQQP